MSVKQVAPEVGYANASALARAFTQRLGQSPTAWLTQESRAASLVGRGAEGRQGIVDSRERLF
jgi:AraC-like DNA-binding protein